MDSSRLVRSVGPLTDVAASTSLTSAAFVPLQKPQAVQQTQQRPVEQKVTGRSKRPKNKKRVRTRTLSAPSSTVQKEPLSPLLNNEGSEMQASFSTASLHSRFTPVILGRNLPLSGSVQLFSGLISNNSSWF